MDWQPITLCDYSRAEVNFSNQLLSGVDGKFQISLNEQAYRVYLTAYGRDYHAVIVLRCRIGDGAVSVYLNEPALDFLLANVIPASSFRTLPEDLQLALLSAAVFPLADVLQKQLGIALTTERFESLPDTAVGGLLLRITPLETTAAQSVVVLAAIDNPLPAAVIEWLQSAGQAPVAMDYSWLTLPVDLQVGRASLKVSDVESLKFGDIMLMSTSYLSEGRLRVSISDHFSCLAQIDGNDLTVQTQPGKIMAEESGSVEGADEMTDAATADEVAEAATPDAADLTVPAAGDAGSSTPHADQPDPLDTSDLPMNVLFVAGRFNITLKELQTIQPGYVFDLKKDARREIEIRVNGTEIASGELVEVDGRTGVRVVECK